MYRTRPMMSGDVELDRLLKFVDAIINAGVQREVEAESRRTRPYNPRFMREQLAVILSNHRHPLRFLVNPRTRTWYSRSHLSMQPTVQAGHLTSLHSGARERLAIEDSLFNQLSNWRGERQGAIFQKQAVNVGGVPVEERTARVWERIGKLPRGTVDRAPKHPGWVPR